MTKRVAILCLGVVATAAPAAADDHPPSSLRMRAPRSSPVPWRSGAFARRIAQVPPDGSSDGSADGAGDAPASEPPSPSAGAPPPEVSAPPAAPSDGDRGVSAREDGKTEVISVTDASAEHELFTGREPVTVVTREDLAASGRATLGDILQALPAQGNASNAQVNAGGDGTTRVSLRGLGAARTLVLLNGRRIVHGGPGADASVDVNAIPVAMIERVEILKDGASAIYGADAVGGVVNIITRSQFDGADVTLLSSASPHGDGTEYDASAVTGFTSKDKNTYIVLSGGYQHHDPVLAGDRGFSTFQDSYDFATRTVTRNTSLATPSGRLDARSIGGGIQVPGCPSGICKPTASGGWTDFDNARDPYNDTAQNYLYTPSTRYSALATGGNRINDYAAVFAQVLFQYRNSDRQLSPAADEADVPISKDNMYNPFGADIVDFRRRMTELGPRHFFDRATTTQAVVGITGSAPDSWGPFNDWKYEISENYGTTSTKTGTTGQLDKYHLADALGPSMLDSTGTPVCVRTPGDLSTEIIYFVLNDKLPTGKFGYPCVPINMLVPAGAIPSSQLARVTFNDVSEGSNTLNTLLATAGGHLAQLPNHGEVTLSLGGDYRHELGDLVPTDSGVPGAGYSTQTSALPTEGSFRTYEGYGELTIVPIHGHDLAQHVELDLGARYVHHNSFGSSLTYQAGGLVRTLEGIAMRGTYSTAFRAPSVFDLFGGRTESTPYAEDPCDTAPPSAAGGTRALSAATQAQCTAQGVPVGSQFTTLQQTAAIGGNRALTAETAATTTLGVVFEPPQIHGLAVSADYWRIAIDNAIETLGIGTIFANCYDRGLAGFCDQIHRDPATHRIASVDEVLQNIDRTVTSGVDVALWYDARIAGLGRLHSGLEGQYLLRHDLVTANQVIHGAGNYDLGASPRIKANVSSHWTHPSGASGGFLVRFVGSYQECAGDDCNNPHNLATASRDVDRYVKVDLYGGYDMRSRIGRTTAQVGINNAFDATPPLVYNAPLANSDPATYDFIGRMVYVRISQLF